MIISTPTAVGSVAVIHYDVGVPAGSFPHEADSLADLGHRQGRPCQISLGSLHKDYFYPIAVLFQSGVNAVKIKGAVGGKIHVVVVDAEIRQRAVSVGAVHTDDLTESIVGRARNGQHHVARAKEGKQSDGEGVGAAEDGGAHKAGLRSEHLGGDAVDGIPSHIAVAVAGGGGEHTLADPLLTEHVQHPLGADAGNFINIFKNIPQGNFGLAGHLAGVFTDLHTFHPFC